MKSIAVNRIQQLLTGSVNKLCAKNTNFISISIQVNLCSNMSPVMLKSPTPLENVSYSSAKMAQLQTGTTTAFT
jgi:hypothetical protein